MRCIETLASCAIAVLLLPGCQRATPPAASAGGARPDYSPQAWVLPTVTVSGQPGLATTPDGRLLLSWIDSTPGRRNALQFAAWDGSGRWQSAPRTIVVGDSLVVDAANPPRLTATSDGALWVHWLQKDPDARNDLQLSRSVDGGFNWSAPLQVATAAQTTELGFATLWPQTGRSVGMAWLDGEAAAASPPTTPPAIATAVQAAVFDANLQRSQAATVDPRACDCCHVSVAVTARGPLLVYRDRSATDVRDIAATRFDGTHWTTPKAVHADGWKMPGCPVNGPAVAANDNQAVVGWYTAANQQPMLQLARSVDAGDSFAAPVVVDRGDAVLGRAAVALDAQQAWVAWLREDASGQSLWVARYSADLSRPLQRVKVATLHGRGGVTGFPQLALLAGHAYVAWTDIAGNSTQLHGAIL